MDVELELVVAAISVASSWSAVDIVAGVRRRVCHGLNSSVGCVGCNLAHRLFYGLLHD